MTTDRRTAIIHAIRRPLRFALRHAAPITLAVFLIVGLAVFDDYGVSVDEGTHRNLGRGVLDYVLGREDSPFSHVPEVDRYYGVAFAMPMAAVERVLRLEDPRAVYLTRHLLNHLFFLVGGFFVWLLAHRMFGSRLLALFAMLLFLLHPRTYGESFFNGKDLPFLSMFAIALYLIHRAFRRDTVWAFVCAGVGVGLLTNTRILGIMPFAAVLGTLALDAIRSARPSWNSAARREGANGARPVLANLAAFSLASVIALYATWPLLWEQPAALIDAFWSQARHPPGDNLFHGEMIRAPNIPWFYVPEWLLVSVPPAALALSAAGAALALFAGLRRWRDALGNSPERFALLLVAFILIPIIAVIALDSHVYNGWRHLYFIYAPMCLLAALALGRIAAALESKPRIRAGVYALAAASLAITAVQMVRLHPYQYIYFNPLAAVHENLGETYEMDYWGIGRREALEWLLTTYPERHMIVKTDVASRWDIDRNLYVFPEDERRRISARSELPHFHVTDAGEDPIWSREIYGVPIVSIIDMREETEAAYRDAYARAAASALIARGGFDVYLDSGSLIYVKDPCAADDTRERFLLSVFPIDADDLPELWRDAGHRSLNFDFRLHGAIFDGKCVIMRTLPDFPIGAIETGQYVPGEDALWKVTVVTDPVRLAAYRQARETATAREPVARSRFDVYLDGKTLTYVKDPCAAQDTRGRFLLSVFPKSQDDLPPEFRALGHESLNFDFDEYGATLDGGCVIARTLPDFPVGAIETGQYIPGGETLWNVTTHTDPDRLKAHRQAHETAMALEPVAESGFEIYLDGKTLIYVKDPCAAADARGRFLLSVFPKRQGDLPDEFRALGHESLNFDFDEYGAAFDGKCVIMRALPDYPIASIETGQWTPPSGERLWSVEFDIVDD